MLHSFFPPDTALYLSWQRTGRPFNVTAAISNHPSNPLTQVPGCHLDIDCWGKFLVFPGVGEEDGVGDEPR